MKVFRAVAGVAAGGLTIFILSSLTGMPPLIAGLFGVVVGIGVVLWMGVGDV